MLRLRTFKILLLSLLGVIVVLISILIKAAPQGGTVEAGDITIVDSGSGNSINTLITQQTDKGVINWQSFNIGPTEHTHFAQPSANAITLNRVTGGDVSSILGQLTATGKIWLLNPAGIFFGSSARVDVAGLVASTANINTKAFLAGNYYLTQGPAGNTKIVNQGYIKIADNGAIFLVAPGIENIGIIEANLGKVVLGSTPINSSYVIDFYGDQLLQFALSPDEVSNISNTITQSGQIIAPGGKVLLSANTAKSIIDKSINMSGIIEASSISTKGGQVILSGGEKGIVEVSGKIYARSDGTNGVGGKVAITGEKVGLFPGAIIDVSGKSGGGEILIGAKYVDGNILSASQAVFVDRSARILANAVDYGPGGKIIIWSNLSTRFYGTAEAKGGLMGGPGGFVETSSKNWLDVSSSNIDVSAPQGKGGTWLLDPYNITIVNIIPSPPEGSWSGGDPDIWTPNIAKGSELWVGDIKSKLLGGTNVTVETPQGDITWLASAALDVSAATMSVTLHLIAQNNIAIYAAIKGSNLQLVLETQANTGGIIAINTGTSKFINIGSITTMHTGTGTGQTRLNASEVITTALAQTYNTPIVLLTDTDLNAGNVIFASTITGGGHSLTIDATGNATFSDTIGVGIGNALNNFIVGATSGINLNAGTITTTGTQQYKDGVTLGKTTTISGKNISFDDTIAGGGFDLSINSTGTATFSGAISTLGNLVVSALSGITLDAGTISTTGTQQYQSAVTLSKSTTINAGNLSFDSTIVGGGYNLNINATGSATFSNTIGVGTGNALNNFIVGATGGINLGAGQIKTTATQQYKNAVTLGKTTTINSGNLIFDSTIIGGGFDLNVIATGSATFWDTISALNNFIVGATGGINLNAGTITATGTQQYKDGVILGKTTTISGKNISFDDTIAGGGFDLSINSTGTATFSGAISTLGNLVVSALSGITLDAGTISTTGTQQYQSAVTLSKSTTINAGNLSFDSTIVGGGYNLNINATGSATFSNTIGVGTGNALNNFIVGATGGINLGAGQIKTTATQQYKNAVTLGKTTTINSGNLIFDSTIIGGGFDLNVIATGSATFWDTISALNNFIVGATIGINLNAGTITTTGTQQYKNAVTLGKTTTLTTTAGDIIFDNSINGFYGLNVAATGNVTLGGAIGAGSALDYLVVSAAPVTGVINLAGGSVRTTGNQQYNSAVILGANTILTAGNIFFANTISSAIAGSYGLAVTIPSATGTAIFSGAIGSPNALSYFTTSGLGTTYLRGGIVTTTGNQLYNTPVLLGADTTITATNVEFGTTGTINSENLLTPPYAYSLTVNATADTKFKAPIGNTNPLYTLATDPVGRTIFYKDITTIGAQTYKDAIILNANVMLTTSGNIVFDSTINGPHDLILNAGSSDISFGGDVGSYATDPLTHVSVIGMLKIVNARNVLGNAPIYTSFFYQVGGNGVTSFTRLYTRENPSIVVSGPYVPGSGTGHAIIKTYQLSGYIDVGDLFVDVYTIPPGSLTGYVNGSTNLNQYFHVPPGALDPSQIGKRFFYNIDFVDSTIGAITDSMLAEILNSLTANYNFGFGFGYGFLKQEYGEFDYLLLLDSMECEAVGN